MINHVWTVLCSRSLIDSETNNVSLLDVIEQINIQGPAPPEEGGIAPVTFEVVTLWTTGSDNQPTRGQAKILLRNPSGDVESELGPFELDLTSFSRVRTRVKFIGLPAKLGRFTFCVQSSEAEGDWQDVANIPLIVVFEQNQAQAPSSAVG